LISVNVFNKVGTFIIDETKTHKAAAGRKSDVSYQKAKRLADDGMV